MIRLVTSSLYAITFRNRFTRYMLVNLTLIRKLLHSKSTFSSLLSDFQFALQSLTTKVTQGISTTSSLTKKLLTSTRSLLSVFPAWEES